MTFETKDSGERVDFASGMRRDTDKGKPRYDLIPEPMLTRWAELMGRGAEKYGERNWERANSQEEADRFIASAWRHFVQWARGDRDEDHGAAVMFNIAAYEKVMAELDPFGPSYHTDEAVRDLLDDDDGPDDAPKLAEAAASRGQGAGQVMDDDDYTLCKEINGAGYVVSDGHTRYLTYGQMSRFDELTEQGLSIWAALRTIDKENV